MEQVMDQGGMRQSMGAHPPLGPYDPGAFFCEMLRPGMPGHPAIERLLQRLASLPLEALRRRAADTERELLERGITFTVYSDATAIDRILDALPHAAAAAAEVAQ